MCYPLINCLLRQDGYTFSNALSDCVTCGSSQNVISIAVVAALATLGVALFIFRRRVPTLLFNVFPMNVLKHLDRGKLKVLWSTYQLISTVSWNLSLVFPFPFSQMVSFLGFLQLDFLSLDCVR